MRDTKFRGKRIDNVEWVYGNLVQTIKEGVYILKMPSFIPAKTFPAQMFIEVHSESVGQYTGLKDKEGKELYDGDVVKYEVYNLNEQSHFYNGEIQWRQGQLGTWWRYKSKNTTFMLKTGNVFKMEKIGNIHDNPELLEKWPKKK